MRVYVFALIATLGSLLLALAAAELAARLELLSLPTQVIRDRTGLDVRMKYGVPVWGSERPENLARQQDDCMAEKGEDALQVLMLGSSILYGVSLEPEESPGAQLARALESAGISACVQNYAQPAFTFQAERALSLDLIPALTPDLVIWEIWGTSPTRFVMMGDTALNTNLAGMEAETIPLPGWVTPALHGELIASHLYTYLWLNALPPAPRVPGAWQRFAQGPLSEAADQIEAEGGVLLLALAPELSRSFTSHIESPDPIYDEVIALAQERGLAYTRLEQGLLGPPAEQLRIDTCCHYSAAGSARIGDHLAAQSIALLSARRVE